MTNWRVTVEMGDLFHPEDDSMHDTRIRNDPKYFKKIRDEMVKRLDNHDDKIKGHVRFHEFETYKELKHHLSISKTLSKFNDYWSYLYDWADSNLVWINTFPPQKKAEYK